MSNPTSDAYWFLRQLRKRAVQDGKPKWQMIRIERWVKLVERALVQAFYDEQEKTA